MKTLTTTLFLALSLTLSSLASDEVKETYIARLSRKDHFNSNEDRLESAAAIIRQDRANFHKFGRRDREDETDEYFASSHNRELLEKLIERGSADTTAIRAILNGTPLIRVRVFTNEQTGNDFIRVTVLSDD